MSVYDELIAMDAAYSKGVAVLACEMGIGRFSKLAIKYWTLIPCVRGIWHEVAALEQEQERERFLAKRIQPNFSLAASN